MSYIYPYRSKIGIFRRETKKKSSYRVGCLLRLDKKTCPITKYVTVQGFYRREAASKSVNELWVNWDLTFVKYVAFCVQRRHLDFIKYRKASVYLG